MQPDPTNVAAGTGAHLATQITVGGIVVIALRHRQLAVGRRFKFHISLITADQHALRNDQRSYLLEEPPALLVRTLGAVDASACVRDEVFQVDFRPDTLQISIMSARQRLIATLPVSKQVLEESFIDGDELTTKILPGIRHTENVDALNTRKRGRESEEMQAAKRSKGSPRPFGDSLPTPWKVDSYVEGPLEITREERLVREEKYKIFIDISIQSLNNIKGRMTGKGWDLMYAAVSNSGNIVVEVPPEFGHRFQDILEDLKEILTVETESGN
ncbi:hypothetical protein VDGL01_12052 [Verticillium dahliae]